MLLVEKADALLNGITRKDVEHLSPAQRKRLAWVLRRIADIADPPQKAAPPRSGVLLALNSGDPRHE